MITVYPKDKKFELRVKDTGNLDQFDVFVNGPLRSHVSDDEIHLFPITHSDNPMAIAVHFEGTDGGKSAIVDITDPDNPGVVSSQTGLIHSYVLTSSA